MSRSRLVVFGAAALLAGAIACGHNSNNPVSPSSTTRAGNAATSDAVTLKATAPTPKSPVGDVRLTDSPTLIVDPATGRFDNSITFLYRYQVFNAGGTLVADSGPVDSTSWRVPNTLDFDAKFTWRARAEYQGATGPWSDSASFFTPAGGHISGSELYDPLNNNKTVGTPHGAVTFSRQGATLNTLTSYISYQLPQTLTAGEFSLLVTNMPANTEGGKTKVMAMGQGFSDIITNDRRMTVEKRGFPAGMVAWRFITHDDQIDTGAGERRIVNFLADHTYLFRATWGGNRFELQIRDGAHGNVIYDMSKHYAGVYDPNPHVIYVGAPVGRSGPDGASVQGATIRQVWVSSRPRPESANQ
ncbi:MAG: hypothetical protein ACM3SQ_19485 [Betaproteobacteria bacterium]